MKLCFGGSVWAHNTVIHDDHVPCPACEVTRQLGEEVRTLKAALEVLEETNHHLQARLDDPTNT